MYPTIPRARRRSWLRHRGIAERHLRRLDGFNGEGTADARDLAVDLGLIHQFFPLGVRGDAGVDLVHLGPPPGAVFLDGLLQVARVVRIGVKRNLPVLPVFRLCREFPPATVGVGDGLLAFLLLLQRKFRAEVVCGVCRRPASALRLQWRVWLRRSFRASRKSGRDSSSGRCSSA